MVIHTYLPTYIGYFFRHGCERECTYLCMQDAFENIYPHCRLFKLSISFHHPLLSLLAHPMKLVSGNNNETLPICDAVCFFFLQKRQLFSKGHPKKNKPQQRGTDRETINHRFQVLGGGKNRRSRTKKRRKKGKCLRRPTGLHQSAAHHITLRTWKG